MSQHLDANAVREWLESAAADGASEEIASAAKNVVANYLRKNPKLLVELQDDSAAVAYRKTPRISVCIAPDLPLMPSTPGGVTAASGDDDGGGGLERARSLKHFKSSPSVSPRKSAIELKKLNKQQLFMELLHDVVSPDFNINSLSHKILVNVLLLVNADRSSLFLVEGSKESPILVSRLFDVTENSSLSSVLHDETEALVIPFGVGIVGQAALTGEVINLSDAYKCPHFNVNVDKMTGYRTKAILCMPLKIASGEVIGVAQVINKKDGSSFSDEDVEVFGMYLKFCAIGLVNAQLFEQTFTHSKRQQSLLELTRKLFEDTTSLEDILKCIMAEAQGLVPCSKCMVLVVDQKEKELDHKDSIVFRSALQLDSSESREMKSIDPKSVNGLDLIQHVVRTRQIINLGKNSEQISGIKIEGGSFSSCVLCMPVLSDAGNVLAVVKMEDKLNGLPFNKAEQDSFEVFAMFCGLAIHSVLNYEKLQIANAKQSVALEVLSYHASATLSEAQHFLSMQLPSVSELQLSSIDFDDLSISDEQTVLASFVMFKELGFLSSFHIDEKSLLRWVLTVRKNYRPVLYHNWRHAFNVAQTMFTLLTTGNIRDKFSDLEKFALLIACFSHDLDHRGTNNAFQSKIDSPLAQIYSTSTMEHHHFDHCIMILNSEGNNVLESLSSDQYSTVLRFIESSILATDLAMYFKKRDNFFSLIKEGTFRWEDIRHKEIMRGMLMTACDVAAVSKPWIIQRRVAELVTSEFFEQGDRERNDLHLEPIAMMDRKKKHELPQMQIGFIKGVCLPLYEVLAQIDTQLAPLRNGARANQENWQKQMDTPTASKHTPSTTMRSRRTSVAATPTSLPVANGNAASSKRTNPVEAWRSEDKLDCSHGDSQVHNRQRKKCIIS